jgi:hypothetical protein
VESEDSRLDARIKSDALIAEGIAELWEALWLAIQETATKLRAHYQINLILRRNDGNTLIQVTAPVRYEQREEGQVKPVLEVRFEREQEKVVARLAHQSGRGAPSVHNVKADTQINTLTFDGRTATQLAEFLVAERLLGMKLG